MSYISSILLGKLRTRCDNNKPSVQCNTSLRGASYGRSCKRNKVIREIAEVPREGLVESVELERVPEGRVELG